MIDAIIERFAKLKLLCYLAATAVAIFLLGFSTNTKAQELSPPVVAEGQLPTSNRLLEANISIQNPPTQRPNKPALTKAQRAKFLVRPPSDEWKARYGPHVVAFATANNLPPNLVMAVIAIESGFNPKARSKDGATGLMQIKYATARAYGLSSGHGPQALYDPITNIRVATNYLGAAYKMTNGNICAAVSRYNRGLGSAKRNPEYCAKVVRILQYSDFHVY